MIIKNVPLFSSSSKNTSPSKYKFSTTKTFAGDLELPTINPQQESSLLSVRCPWGSMKAGIRFSSTCQTSPAELTAVIISKPYVLPSTRTAGSAVFISLIVYTLKKSFLLNSSFSYQSKSSSEWYHTVFMIKGIIKKYIYLWLSEVIWAQACFFVFTKNLQQNPWASKHLRASPLDFPSILRCSPGDLSYILRPTPWRYYW